MDANYKARFEDNLFSDHRTILPMKLMVSTMPLGAIKRRYSSVLPFYVTVRQFLIKFVEQ